VSPLEINSGLFYSDPIGLTTLNNELFFWSTNGLYKYNGDKISLAASNILSSIPVWSQRYNQYIPLEKVVEFEDTWHRLATLNNELFFTGKLIQRERSLRTEITGYELFKYNYNTNRISLVADLNPGASSSYPSFLTAFNNELIFEVYNDGRGEGDKLYKYDGNTVKSISGLSGSGVGLGYSFTIFNDNLLFVTEAGDAGLEPYKYDGNQVILLADINPGAAGSGALTGDRAIFNKELFFNAYNENTGFELYKYDGSKVRFIADINPGINGSYPNNFTAFNNELLFSAYTPTTGQELYKYDGNQVSFITDINPGINGSYPNNFTAFNNEVLFSAYNETIGNELYKYDGNQVSLLADINPGSNSSAPGNFVTFNNELFFRAENETIGTELYRYDGKEVSLVADIFPGSQSANPRDLIIFNNELIFSADTIDPISCCGIKRRRLFKVSATPTGSTTVPEPRTLFGLLTLGLLGVNSAFRRKQKAPHH
jgi:ELWxxDGT repeat protein